MSNPGLCRDLNTRAVEQAVKAFTLILQAGHFGLAAFDVADGLPHAAAAVRVPKIQARPRSCRPPAKISEAEALKQAGALLGEMGLKDVPANVPADQRAIARELTTRTL